MSWWHYVGMSTDNKVKHMFKTVSCACLRCVNNDSGQITVLWDSLSCVFAACRRSSCTTHSWVCWMSWWSWFTGLTGYTRLSIITCRAPQSLESRERRRERGWVSGLKTIYNDAQSDNDSWFCGCENSCFQFFFFFFENLRTEILINKSISVSEILCLGCCSLLIQMTLLNFLFVYEPLAVKCSRENFCLCCHKSPSKCCPRLDCNSTKRGTFIHQPTAFFACKAHYTSTYDIKLYFDH